MNITLILSSVRESRIALRVLEKVKSLVGDQFNFNVVDPMEFDLPLLNLRFFEMKNPDEKFIRLHNRFNDADGFIIITAEYNHGIPPALKNMLDHFGKEFSHKSCGIISYSDGAIGGARCTEQLRLVCSTLGMPPISISPAWGLVNKSGTPEGKPFEDGFERTFRPFLKEFIWMTEALSDKRMKDTSSN